MGKIRVGNFRSNIFGGFNRRDVIGYIEQLHRKLSDLEEENELLRIKLPAQQPEDNDGITSQIEQLELGAEASGSKKEQSDSEPSLDMDINENSLHNEPEESDLLDEEVLAQQEESPVYTEPVKLKSSAASKSKKSTSKQTVKVRRRPKR